MFSSSLKQHIIALVTMILRYAVILITQWGRLESRSRCFIIVMKHQVKLQYVLRVFKIVPQQKKSDEILMTRPQIYSLLGTPCNSVYYNSAAINPPFVKVMLLSQQRDVDSCYC